MDAAQTWRKAGGRKKSSIFSSTRATIAHKSGATNTAVWSPSIGHTACLVYCLHTKSQFTTADKLRRLFIKVVGKESKTPLSTFW
jgi:hypothetical protein